MSTICKVTVDTSAVVVVAFVKTSFKVLVPVIEKLDTVNVPSAKSELVYTVAVPDVTNTGGTWQKALYSSIPSQFTCNSMANGDTITLHPSKSPSTAPTHMPELLGCMNVSGTPHAAISDDEPVITRSCRVKLAGSNP